MLKPRATTTRDLVNLDGMWRFAIDTAVGDSPWSARLSSRTEAAVPASYNDLFVDPAIRDHVGWVWYQRQIVIPRTWDGERRLLRFDAATHEARVYLDDVLVGTHVGGYLPFEFDITELACPGAEVRLTVGVGNELTNTSIPPGTITVAADGKRSQSYSHDFYNYAGLARSVWLYSAPAVCVTDVTVQTDFDGPTGRVSYVVGASGAAEVRVRLADEDGRTVAEAVGAAGELRVPDVTLWRPKAAYLYSLTVELHRDGMLVDSYPLAVGIRTVEVRGTEFLINGQPFYFTGFGKHEDAAIRGKGHDDASLVHDFQLLDWVGANSFRTSHYPYAEEVLEFADRQGIVVIDETAAVGLNLAVVAGLTGQPPQPTFSPDTIGDETREAHAEHLRALIARDKNHPSVVMWCIANEPSSNEQGAREYFEPLVDLARVLDPTRPLTYAIVMFATPDTDLIADLFDVLSLNRYYGWYVDIADLDAAEGRLEAELRAWIDRFGKPIMMSEYGADTLAGVHSVRNAPWSEEYQTEFLAMNHRVFDRVPGFVGEQVWNFADFETGPAIHRVDGNKKGVFTRDRKPKAAAHALRARWRRIGQRKPDAAS